MNKPLDGWFSTVLKSIADGVIVTDADARVSFMNRVAEELTGWNEAQAVGQTVGDVFELIDEETGRRESWPLRESLASGQPAFVPQTTLLVSRAGRKLHISDAASPIRDDRGTITGVVIVFRDVSQKKRIDDAIHESEKRFRALVSASSDVMYRMSRDWTEMQPLDGRGLVASNTGPINDWMEQNIPLSEHDRVRDAIHEAVSGKKTFELEHQVIRPDGTLGWTFSRAIPILDAHGEITEWLGTASDVTQRKQADEALEEARSRAEQQARNFEATLAAVQDFVFVFDKDERIVFANRALLALWGLAADEAVGRTMEQLSYPEDTRVRVTASIREVIETGRPVSNEVPYRNPGGISGHYEYTLAPVLDAAGTVVQVAGSARDTTKRRAAEDALKEADRRKDEFLAMLAHELRNPLAAVGSAVTVLKMSGDPENVNFAKEVVERQTRQLARLIDDLLDVSRITSGKIRLKRELCDAGTILKHAINSVHPLVSERKHNLHTDFDEGTLPLRADPTRVEQIVVNLLTNAAKYTENGGCIRLAGERTGDQIVISVEDNGNGIPPEKLPQMFELFAQGERSIARSEGGLGIGLTIVQKLAEMHGGSVLATSKGPGKGSTFTVRLPAASPSSSLQKTPGVVASAERRGSRILVVDDNKDTADGLVRLLKLLGNEVQMAHDGTSAIDLARIHKPEFVLLDIGLPGMDGYQVAQKLREEPCCKAAIVIAVSGYGQDEDRRRSREAGFDHHLVKPVDFDALISLLTQSI
jgi:PAS domain S-box-containing protein